MKNKPARNFGIRLAGVALTLYCTFLSFIAAAQNFGGNPASVKWRQVNSNSVKVVFPKGLDSIASRVATITDLLHEKYSGTLGDKYKKISIILQPDVTFSNAYVMLGPYRSEYYMMAPQNPFELGSMSWADNLAVHEFRHVEQYSNFNVGLAKVFAVFAGENGRALANAMAVPDWLFEGDAVWNETVLSGQGRGRLPAFFSSYKSVLREGRTYNYMKMRNGSLRQFVPNHYYLGYLLVSYGRQAYGDSIWKNITHDAASFKPLIYPLQGALKKYTGIKYSTFVNNAMSDFRQKWESSTNTETVQQWITPVSNKNVTDYRYPYPAEDGTMIVLKTSYRQIPTFVKVRPDGSDEKIAVKDIGYDDYFSYKNGRIIYTSLQPDIRWANRDYSIIRLLDVNTKQVQSITYHSRYFSPDLTTDCRKIVAVENQPARFTRLVLMDAEGKVQKSFTPDSSLYYSHPKFLADDINVVVAARKPDGQMGWMIWGTTTNDIRWLLPPAHRLVGFPLVQGDTLFYTATEGGNDGLYAQLISTGNRFLVVNYPTGVYQGYVKSGKVIGSFFTAGGYRLGMTTATMAPMLTAQAGLIPLYNKQMDGGDENVSDVETKIFPSKKYSRNHGFLNVHSWQPELNEPDYTFRLYGNNVLNTTQTELFYTYNTNENSNAAGVNFVYGGWFLQPFLQGKQTWGREVVYNQDTTFVYNETDGAAGLQLPLNLSSGKHFSYLTLSSSIHIDNVNWTGIGKGLLRDLDYTYLQNRLVFSSQTQKAKQNIYPRFAQSLVADYKNMVDSHSSWQMLLSGAFYFPGLATNHSLVVTAAYQARDTMRQYTFSNSFPFSRGYNSVNYPRMFKVGANYHFPVCYPDWGFGDLLYFLRIRGNVFYDYTEVKSLRTGLTRPFSTVGGEVYFDSRIWNQLPVTVGVRYSYLLDKQATGSTQPNQWEIILPVNLF